jgi:hypothetical protein
MSSFGRKAKEPNFSRSRRVIRPILRANVARWLSQELEIASACFSEYSVMSHWLKDLRDVEPAPKLKGLKRLPRWAVGPLVVITFCGMLGFMPLLQREYQLTRDNVRKSPNRRRYTEILFDGTALDIGYFPEGNVFTGGYQPEFEVNGKIISAEWRSNQDINITLAKGTRITLNTLKSYDEWPYQGNNRLYFKIDYR